MLTILPILLLIASPAAMLLIRLVRPRFNYFWLVAAAGALSAWGVMVWLRVEAPVDVPLVTWEPASFFPHSPALLLDAISWPFALGLAAIAAAAILTDVSRAAESGWKAWASIQILAALGLSAILAANPLTLLLAWTALDLMELAILLGQVKESAARERIVAGFTTRVAGLLALLWASLASINTGENLTFQTIAPGISPFLLLAAGLRLGVLPLHQPFLEDLPLRRSLGAMLRLAPAAASLTLLARTAHSGASEDLAPALFFISGLAALYAGISWASTTDEVAGRPFWILGAASCAVGAAVIQQPAASLAWGVTGLLSGGMLFLFSARHRALSFLPILGLLFFTALPFTPAAGGAGLYQGPYRASGVLFVVAHALLMAGYLRHGLRPGRSLSGAERWVWAIYPLGLALLPLSQALQAYWAPEQPGFAAGIAAGFAAPDRSILAAWPALAAVLLGVALLFLFRRGLGVPERLLLVVKNVLSFRWVYRALWSLYQITGRALGLINNILEGEGGILWMLLILTLLLALFMQAGQGGS